MLHQAGFSTEDILQIATINGAVSMDLGNMYGSVKPGKKANLVIFKNSPFEDYKNFLAEKIVIKDGKVSVYPGSSLRLSDRDSTGPRL